MDIIKSELFFINLDKDKFLYFAKSDFFDKEVIWTMSR